MPIGLLLANNNYFMISLYFANKSNLSSFVGRILISLVNLWYSPISVLVASGTTLIRFYPHYLQQTVGAQRREGPHSALHSRLPPVTHENQQYIRVHVRRKHAPDNPGGRVGGGGLGGALRDAEDQRVRARARPPLRAGAAHRRHAPRHVPTPHRLLQGGAPLIQARHHLQHGRVCWSPARPSGVLPLLHVERVFQAHRHRAAECARAGRQRARPRRRVPALRDPDTGRRGHPSLRRRDRPRRAHRLQRAGLFAGVANPCQNPRLRHSGSQQAILRQRHQQSTSSGADGRRRHRDGCQGSDDPHHWRAQVPCPRQGGGGGSQPYVDGVRLPAARPNAVRVRRGRHARA